MTAPLASTSLDLVVSVFAFCSMSEAFFRSSTTARLTVGDDCGVYTNHSWHVGTILFVRGSMVEVECQDGETRQVAPRDVCMDLDEVRRKAGDFCWAASHLRAQKSPAAADAMPKRARQPGSTPSCRCASPSFSLLYCS